MKIKNLLLSAVALAATLTSCNTGSNSYTYNVPYSMLNVVTVNGKDTYSIGTATYTITSEENSDQLVLTGVPATDNFTSSITFGNLTDKVTTEGYTFSLTGTSTISGCTTPSSFSASMKGYYTNADYKIALNSGATLYGICNGVSFLSETTVTCEGQTVVSTNDTSNNAYQIVFNEKDINTSNRTMTLYIYYAKFMDGMPSMTMSFTDIPFSVSNGLLSFSRDALTPNSISGSVSTPQESFPITNLSGSGLLGSGTLYISFECAYTDKSGSTKTYLIRSSLKYLLSSSTTYDSAKLQ